MHIYICMYIYTCINKYTHIYLYVLPAPQPRSPAAPVAMPAARPPTVCIRMRIRIHINDTLY